MKLEREYPDCQPIGISTSSEGVVECLDVRFVRDGRQFRMKVATPGYVEAVKQDNLGLPQEAQLDDNIFPMDGDLPSKDRICQALAAIPFENLQPFLSEVPEPAKPYNQ